MKSHTRTILLTALLCATGVGFVAAKSFSATAAAQGPAVTAAAPRIATVDVLAVVERFVLSDKFTPAREALAAEKNKAMEPIAATLDSIEAKAKLLPANSPELRPLQEQYQQAQQQLDAMSETARREVEAFNVKQLNEAYGTVNDAASALADKLGYTHVLASRNGPTSLRSTTVNNAVQEMIARPVVKAPAEDDLTQRLIDQLGLATVQIPDPTKPKPVTAQPVPAQPVPAQPATAQPGPTQPAPTTQPPK